MCIVSLIHRSILLLSLSITLDSRMQLRRNFRYQIYSNAKQDKQVERTSVYHSRQSGIVLKARSYRKDYTVICFMTHVKTINVKNVFLRFLILATIFTFFNVFFYFAQRFLF